MLARDLFSIADERQVAQAHSATSRAAASNITRSGSRTTQCEKIKEWMNDIGQEGATIREVSNHLRIGMNVASARMRDLDRQGSIVKTKIIRRAEGSTQGGEVYVIAHRWCPELGRGDMKDTVDKVAYKKIKDALEWYSSGQTDGGLKARRILQEVDPIPGDYAA